ncbi:tyrosine recombinase XerC [uncultured Umboniibacter sp.]|uniref:tyrosine recombinase XerC n=1 Tax=uncultured Umboniibacter sp. TaxID=1798917 RepID=UPI0026185962|nr:tyrosine recombinase XerC [uncultured Umboniibacter sp.]
MHKAVAQWVEHLTVERRLSPHTISSYRRDIQRFIDDEPQPLEKTLAVSSLRAQIANMSRAGLATRSIARALSSLQTFVKWARQHGLLSEDFALPALKRPKLPKPLPKVLDVDATVAAVVVAGDEDADLRDRALLELLYSSGLRLAELAGLNVSDVNLPRQQLKVLGKGSKERIIPFGSHAKKALQRWIVRRQLAPSSALFINLQSNARLSHRGIQYIVEKRGQQAGLDVRLHPHLLRHAFASHLLEGSGDLRAVQELLGHENISTTQVYTHLNFQHLTAVYDQAHPRAKKK